MCVPDTAAYWHTKHCYHFLTVLNKQYAQRILTVNQHSYEITSHELIAGSKESKFGVVAKCWKTSYIVSSPSFTLSNIKVSPERVEPSS